MNAWACDRGMRRRYRSQAPAVPAGPGTRPPPPAPPSPSTGPLRFAGSPRRRAGEGSQLIRLPLSHSVGPWGLREVRSLGPWGLRGPMVGASLDPHSPMGPQVGSPVDSPVGWEGAGGWGPHDSGCHRGPSAWGGRAAAGARHGAGARDPERLDLPEHLDP